MLRIQADPSGKKKFTTLAISPCTNGPGATTNITDFLLSKMNDSNGGLVISDSPR